MVSTLKALFNRPFWLHFSTILSLSPARSLRFYGFAKPPFLFCKHEMQFIAGRLRTTIIFFHFFFVVLHSSIPIFCCCYFHLSYSETSSLCPSFHSTRSIERCDDDYVDKQTAGVNSPTS